MKGEKKMYCKPSQVLPAIVHPTKHCVQNTYNNVVQPHIHPTHNTLVNHTNVQNKHYFPQTQSVQNVVTSQNFNMGPGPSVAGAYSPGMGMGPGPGQVAGAYSPGMGMGPGQVAGAYSPGMGMGPGQVAGAMSPGAGYGSCGCNKR